MTTTNGPICIDETLTVLAEYDPRVRWNGWLGSPFLDAWSVEAVFETLRPYDEYNDLADFRMHEWTDDGVLVVITRDTVGGVIEEFREEIAPNEDGLYALGAYSWIWSEDETPWTSDNDLTVRAVNPCGRVVDYFDADVHAQSGLGILHGIGPEIVLIDEVEPGFVRVGLYPNGETETPTKIVETDDPATAIDLVRGWGF